MDKSKKTNKTLQKIWQYRVLYLFLVPMLIWFLVFCYIPMIGNILAFKDYSFTGGIFGSPWAGLKYFKQFFNYYDFKNVILNTIIIALIKIVLEFPIPIVFALLLNELTQERFKKVVQSVSYLPHFVSWVIVIQMFTMMLSPQGGLINQIAQGLGLINEPVYFMGKKELFYPLVVLTDLFKDMGWSSIIYLASLSSINTEIYEAAAIDGASRFKSAIHITLPFIKPTAGLLFIMGFSNILRSGFDQIYLLQNPSIISIAETLDTFVFKQGVLSGNVSYGTAIGFFQSLISLVLIVLVNKFAQKKMEISLW